MHICKIFVKLKGWFTGGWNRLGFQVVVVQSRSQCPAFCNPMQHARFPCPPITPRVCSNSCPLSQWCYLTILSCLQSFPESESFPVSQVFTSHGQSIGASASATVLPKNNQDWFLYEGLVGSPCCPRDSQESSSTPQYKSISSSALSYLYGLILTSIHDYWRNHSFD